jgi:hypothetical protein
VDVDAPENSYDRQSARGMPHNPVCPLCGMEPEDAKYLLINCVFTREIYRLICVWFGMRGSTSTCLPSQEPADWLECNVATASTGDGRKVAGILLYCWWNVWKEHNKRIFDAVQNSDFQVACATKDDIELFSLASSS